MGTFPETGLKPFGSEIGYELHSPIAHCLRRMMFNMIAFQRKRLRLAFIGTYTASYTAFGIKLGNLTGLIGQIPLPAGLACNRDLTSFSRRLIQ